MKLGAAGGGRLSDPDDESPRSGATRTAIVREFELTLLKVQRASILAEARVAAWTFASSVSAHAAGDWERARARRLALSVDIAIVLRFDAGVAEAAAIAAELVALPCDRRTAQLREIALLAAYCRDRGAPEAIWPSVLRAVRAVAVDVAATPTRGADARDLRELLENLWAAIPADKRVGLEPLGAAG